MKRIAFILLCLVHLTCFSQSNKQNVSAAGSVVVPSFQSIRVEALNTQDIQLTNAEDYNVGKLITNFCRITVMSNVPWVVSAKTNYPYLTLVSGGGSETVPVSILSLKGNIREGFFPLSNKSQTLLSNQNNNLVNSYYIPLKVTPSWNYPGGEYNTTILFTLTPQ